MPIKVFLRDTPQRAIALGTETHVLIFRHSPPTTASTSTTSLPDSSTAPRCIVEFAPWEDVDMREYRSLPSLDIKGTLGLVTINNDVFICVVTNSKKTATVRPGESIQQILAVDFHCLTRSDYDQLLYTQINPFPTDDLDPDGYDRSSIRGDSSLDHPCLQLKKLLSGGSFYYSSNFDLTKRLQDRPADATTVAIDSLDAGYLWNAYMIQPLVEFRSRLSERKKKALDDSGIITSAIRGFAATLAVPASSSPARINSSGMPSTMTLISRLSCRRAGTRFNARGIDDDGNVANFVETETVFCTDQLCFSYVQCRGSVPVFWEQQSGLPGQQKIQITRSPEATKPAFDKHFDMLSKVYGDIFIVNLLSSEKPGEAQLIQLYDEQIRTSQLNEQVESPTDATASEHQHLRSVNYDFHAETRGPGGYDAARGIKRFIMESGIAFEYYLTEDIQEAVHSNARRQSAYGQNEVLKQNGIFRTNCLDCLDRTNVVQTVISQMVLEVFLIQQGEDHPTSDFWARHGMLWADDGDALSKIYAGTGALKSSFTRSGKHSLAGVLADVRKSAQRFYVNNFEDKGRQNTIDMLLGRLINQMPVSLFDPVNDWVTAEVGRRAPEYTSSSDVNIWIGTFNLNGKTTGTAEDLRPWLCPKKVDPELGLPEIYGVAFQEIVDLDVQQILSTDPNRRHVWEEAVRKTLNSNAQKQGGEEYVLLRGGQLVGASLSVFVKSSVLPYIKNVEGAVKKTGMSGIAGNKGAVAIRMDYADTSICLVTAHLAAGFANYDERNQDYRTISNGLRFQRDRSIEDHKTVIWFGDFNYRIGIGNERARQLIEKGDLGTLYANDQLNLQMVHGRTFPHYSEVTPTFLPTYKFNIGSDEYDTSEKSRIPAWCDRILTRGDNLRQLYYASAPLRFSDHRPVWGLFRCTISVVDASKKDEIAAELYNKRRAIVGDRTANTADDNSDYDELYGYEAVEEGLPPASSDKRKWWLDNSMPATSEVDAPTHNHIPNPRRPSNPFSPTSEPDWVRVEKPFAPQPPPRQQQQTSQPTNATAKSLPTREATTSATGTSRPGLDGTAASETDDSNNTTRTHHLRETLRKPAPPPKPNLLRSASSQSTTQQANRTAPPPLPEPRRKANASSSTANGRASPAATAPALPARHPRASTGLMDEGDGGEGLTDWIPLRPQGQ
ncbi:SacI homology domain-containing protein [Neohortaea acidophila]|uniref:phosphoinositide 5-phosphatase n=1 Tax=Neohortaea acidophila TaxID=245834 RepID=A0A6A6PME9_9PEZI|nr:SacI homology domain-containing protein [Neohortaea acidophila]KAF2480633.1 SacI homology domain-containing protein [Neohortaea acidophila]